MNLLMIFLLAAAPTTRPATSRPAATRPAVHVLTAVEKGRLLELSREAAEINAGIRKEQQAMARTHERKATAALLELRAALAKNTAEVASIRRGTWVPPATQPAKETEPRIGMTFEQVRAMTGNQGYLLGAAGDSKQYRFPMDTDAQTRQYHNIICTFTGNILTAFDYETGSLPPLRFRSR